MEDKRERPDSWRKTATNFLVEPEILGLVIMLRTEGNRVDALLDDL
jgi:hypothetical protein